MSIDHASTMRRSAARDRLLATASELFYREGIHSVGVDRIVSESDVTRATFYRHFPGKEDLVEAYLAGEDAQIRAALGAVESLTDDPDERLEIVLTALGEDVAQHHTRGCPFINAAAEYPDPDSAVRQRIAEHREWFRSQLEQALTAAGSDDAERVAGELVLLRDAALVGGYLDGWDRVGPAFTAAARRLVAAG